jgi:streptomycin 6-kinase
VLSVVCRIWFGESWLTPANMVSTMIIPKQLAASCQKIPERRAWLGKLPLVLEQLTARWSLHVGQPFDHGGMCSWVAPATRADGEPAVLKLAMPHMEGQDEIAGLRIWSGEGMVTLLAADDESGAMLLERCLPGTALRLEPEPKQDEIIAGLLKRIRKATPDLNALGRFRPLSRMIAYWRRETIEQRHLWPDEGLVNEGLGVLEELALPAPTDALLMTDLHAGNVLRSQREPWLVIDPKPFIGDRSYDPVQHLFNCETRLHDDPVGLVHRVADLTEVDRERLRLWTFARAAADARDDWSDSRWMEIARALAR